MQAFSPQLTRELISHLSAFVLPERLSRFDEIISQRIGHMHLALEDVYQAHNASAVLRSADCFGMQHLHFIENRNRYKISGEVALGASQWLSIERHSGTADTFRAFREQGFRVVATSPHANDTTIYKLPVDRKFVLVFGTEKEGISPEGMEHADEFVQIPMYGFTESLNISVCAAICMHELSRRIREEVPGAFLPQAERDQVYLHWLMQSIRKSDLIVKEFVKRNSPLSGK